jgi:MFS superfamily sulfate permease-like transporter
MFPIPPFAEPFLPQLAGTLRGYGRRTFGADLAAGITVGLVAMSLAKLGALIRFIPFPVTTGFTTGIAVVIFTTQVKDLPGLRLAEAPAGFLGRWRAYALAAGTVQWAEAAVGIGTAALVFGLRHWRPRWPAMLLGMVAATAAAAVLGLPPAERRAPFVPSVERDRGRAPVPGGGLS